MTILKYWIIGYVLQRETLIQQLQRNELETDATLEELDARIESEDQDYDM